MRTLIQRVGYAKVTVDNEVIGQIDKGLLVLLGVTHEDTEDIAIIIDWLLRRTACGSGLVGNTENGEDAIVIDGRFAGGYYGGNGGAGANVDRGSH